MNTIDGKEEMESVRKLDSTALQLRFSLFEKPNIMKQAEFDSSRLHPNNICHLPSYKISSCDPYLVYSVRRRNVREVDKSKQSNKRRKGEEERVSISRGRESRKVKG